MCEDLARILATTLIAALILAPATIEANSGDFSGGAAIGASYAGVDVAPTNGLIVQGNGWKRLKSPKIWDTKSVPTRLESTNCSK
jgi:hypothetical protein